MAIGDAVRRYQEQKAIDAAAEAAEDAARIEARAARVAAKEHATDLEEMQSPEVPTAPTMAIVLAQIAAIMERLSTPKETDTDRDAAYRQIELIERLITKTHPENVDHPGKSVYSYPEGDVARPKPEMKCRFYWVGYELHPETLRPEEIELLNRLTPGEYRVTKADGVDIPFRVTAKASDKLDDKGKPTIEELSVWFPCKGDQRQNHLSMISYIQQALGDKIPTVQEMMRELTKLKRELEQARAGVVGVV